MNTAYIPLHKGPKEQTPKRIIVHAMAEYIHINEKDADELNIEKRDYHAVEWLKVLGLSAHAFAIPSGLIIESRRPDQGAWHAKGHNEDTLGIEFLVPGLHDYVSFVEAIKKTYLTNKQYQAGKAWVLDQIKTNEIETIERHSDIDPSRKVDPGNGFPWVRLLQEI